MKKMECKKRAYMTPEIKVYPMENERLLQAASGNAGTIGYGGGGGDAKRWGDEWEDEDYTPTAHPQPLPREGSGYPTYNAWEE